MRLLLDAKADANVQDSRQRTAEQRCQSAGVCVFYVHIYIYIYIASALLNSAVSPPVRAFPLPASGLIANSRITSSLTANSPNCQQLKNASSFSTAGSLTKMNSPGRVAGEGPFLLFVRVYFHIRAQSVENTFCRTIFFLQNKILPISIVREGLLPH